jgi:hypothetical protein
VIRKEMLLPIFLSMSEMPHGGHTETVDAEKISLLQLDKIVKKAIKQLME